MVSEGVARKSSCLDQGGKDPNASMRSMRSDAIACKLEARKTAQEASPPLHSFVMIEYMLYLEGDAYGPSQIQSRYEKNVRS